MSMAMKLVAAGSQRFSIPDRSRHLLCDARRHPRHRARGLFAIDAGRHADKLREARAERAQRRAANLEADLRDAELATPQQRHRSFDAPRHQVRVRRLAIGEAELTAQVPRRHVRAARERLDVKRLRVLAVHPVADAAQPSEVIQVHIRNRASYQAPTYAARCSPVSVERPATRSAGVPSKTIWPPSWPAPGPRSMIQSACAMTAWWCSMTMTDLPESTSRSSRPSSCSMSARCRPVVGSSST